MKRLSLISFAQCAALFAASAAYMLLSATAHAQFDPVSGSYIDECSTQQLVSPGPDGFADVEDTACISGGVGSPSSNPPYIESYVEVYDNYYELDGQPELAAQVQIYGPSGLVYDSGYSYFSSSAYESGSIIPTLSEWYWVNLNITVEWPGQYYNEWNVGGSAEVTPPPTGIQGIIYPKYVVIGVTYAPPGIQSNVQYGSTTSVGSTSTYSSSFSQGYSTSVSTTFGITIPKGVPDAGGGLSLTASSSQSLTQSQNSGTTNTTNKSTSLLFETYGYPTTNPYNGTESPALANDYDTIQVWLNPELIFTATPANGSSPATIQWNGYAYDPYDFDGYDVASIPVGCLNGDFLTGAFATDHPHWCDQAQSDLNRGWVVNEPYQQVSPTTSTAVTAAGCAPQTTESPSICPMTQEAYNILGADPLAYIPGGSGYSGFSVSPLPDTTADGRFTLISGANNPNPVQYQPGQTQTYNATQMNTYSQSNGGSHSFDQKVTVSATSSSTFLSIFNSSKTFSSGDEMTQTNTWLNTLTTTQTDSNAFSITASTAPNYLDGMYAPGEFLAYQDNLYGTFLIYPKW